MCIAFGQLAPRATVLLTLDLGECTQQEHITTAYNMLVRTSYTCRLLNEDRWRSSKLEKYCSVLAIVLWTFPPCRNNELLDRNLQESFMLPVLLFASATLP
jgi:hypothetical protein